MFTRDLVDAGITGGNAHPPVVCTALILAATVAAGLSTVWQTCLRNPVGQGRGGPHARLYDEQFTDEADRARADLRHLE